MILIAIVLKRLAALKPESSGSEMTAKEKYSERMKKLRDLHMKRNEARKINHQEV